MRPRLTLALLAARVASLSSRRLGHGGTVLPGHVVPRIDPSALSHIAHQLTHGVVIVSGTNGKTTTARLLARTAEADGLRPIHNRSGANLMTGVVSAMACSTDLRGRPSGEIGIFEVDEATVGAAVDALSPRVVVLTNVFRDQLDRYGEVELIASRWREAIARLDPHATVVLNVDDPIVAQLASVCGCRVVGYGVEDASLGEREPSHDADRRLCPSCSARLRYTWSLYAHLGHYACASCGWHRPEPDVSLVRGEFHAGPEAPASVLAIRTPRQVMTFRLALPGLYSAYNALAAVAASTAVDLSTNAIVESMERAESVFGRSERVGIGPGAVILTLVKNPVGFNQALRAFVPGQASPSDGEESAAPSSTPFPHNLTVIAINDLFADGTDVSWLWDVDFEVLGGHAGRVLCTGTRAHDLALRLKYAALGDVAVEPRLASAVAAAVAEATMGDRVLLFATYTAMLEVRRELERLGHVAPFWED